jgi:outer membrane protein TolC
MTTYKKYFVTFVPFVIFVVNVFVTGAGAQEVTLRLTLEDAQTRAVAASHRLAEARAREAAAAGVVLAREAADRPNIGAGAGYTRTNHVTEFVFPGPTGIPRVLYPDVPDNYDTRLQLQWPIYNGGRSDALERAARAEASAAAADSAAAQADLRLDVAQAFWSLVTARATIDVLDRGLTRVQAHLKDARERFNAGLTAPNEVSSAEAAESRQRMLLIEARNRQALASAALARLTGLDLALPIEPAATLELPSPASAAIDTLVNDARTTRNDRRALEQRIQAAEEQREAAEGSKRPTISITSALDYARPNPRIFPRADRWDDSWEAGVTAAWSLWDGGRARGEAMQAAGMADAARQRLAEFDSILALEVRQRLLDIDSGRAAVAAAGDAIRAAAEARRVVTERYQAGVLSQTEVLDADVALLQAELDRTRAIADVRLAEARLTRTLGR